MLYTVTQISEVVALSREDLLKSFSANWQNYKGRKIGVCVWQEFLLESVLIIVSEDGVLIIVSEDNEENCFPVIFNFFFFTIHRSTASIKLFAQHDTMPCFLLLFFFGYLLFYFF